ncbi:MAG TPA: hypothetical protein PLP29_12985 [Candidatus Ozemobacteraceae bacterium]|nr:hypothetical protein [Candidatus Ozemobacteraceae bacterium]
MEGTSFTQFDDGPFWCPQFAQIAIHDPVFLLSVEEAGEPLSFKLKNERIQVFNAETDMHQSDIADCFLFLAVSFPGLEFDNDLSLLQPGVVITPMKVFCFMQNFEPEQVSIKSNTLRIRVRLNANVVKFNFHRNLRTSRVFKPTMGLGDSHIIFASLLYAAPVSIRDYRADTSVSRAAYQNIPGVSTTGAKIVLNPVLNRSAQFRDDVGSNVIGVRRLSLVAALLYQGGGVALVRLAGQWPFFYPVLSVRNSPGPSKDEEHTPMTSGIIKREALSLGADACGIAGVDRFEAAPGGFKPQDIFTPAQSVIVFLRVIPSEILDCANPVPYTSLSRRTDFEERYFS